MEGQKSVWAVLCPIWPSSSDCWTKTVSRLTNEDTSRRSEKVLQENMKQQMDMQSKLKYRPAQMKCASSIVWKIRYMFRY